MNVTNIIISLALSICDIMLIRYFLKNRYIEKRKLKSSKVTVEIILLFLGNSQLLPTYISFIIIIVTILLIFNSYSISINKKVILLLTIILVKVLIENLSVILFSWIFNITIFLSKEKVLNPYSILVKIIVRYLYYIFIIGCINLNSTKKVLLYHFKWISLFISAYFSLTIILLDNTLFYFANIGRTFVFIVIVYNFALIMFDRYQRKAEATEKEFIITKQRIEDDKKYLIKTEAAHDEMRAFRHDLTNKLSIISSHIQRDEKDIALKHLEEMGVTIASNKAKIYIGDPSVDSIIDARVDDMLSKGITFEESYGLICIGRIDSYDLALLFALALDNAIEAVERITEGERRISLDIHTQREFLYINIENTFISKGKNDFTRTSKKTNIESHGFGVKKMKSLVNKYDGLMDYHFNGNSVMLKIVLNNNYIKENV